MNDMASAPMPEFHEVYPRAPQGITIERKRDRLDLAMRALKS